MPQDIEMSWKRFPFIDQFPESEQFYSSPRHDGTEFRRAILRTPFRSNDGIDEDQFGRVLSYSLPLTDGRRPCFTFEYALACFAVAALRIREEHFEKFGLPLHPDYFIEITVRDSFEARLSSLLSAESGQVMPINVDKHKINERIRSEAGEIFCWNYDEAANHYEKWYGSWNYPDMRPYLTTAHGPTGIADALSDTSDLNWVP